MATGSASDARQRLALAGYWTGASSAQSQPRCDGCAHVEPSPKLFGKTRYDRYCSLHLAGVKTHGCCLRHTRPTAGA